MKPGDQELNKAGTHATKNADDINDSLNEE